jgi:sodium/bile acid cotransporter 7
MSYPTLNVSPSKSYSTMSLQQPEHPSPSLDFALTIHPVSNEGPAENQQDNTPIESSSTSPDRSIYIRAWNKWCAFYTTNSFLILVICAILLAYAYPPLGAVYLAPQITATWIAVVFIFILAGMGIKTEELSKAFTRFYFNLFVQVFNFGVVSSIVYGFSRFMLAMNALPQVRTFICTF